MVIANSVGIWIKFSYGYDCGSFCVKYFNTSFNFRAQDSLKFTFKQKVRFGFTVKKILYPNLEE